MIEIKLRAKLITITRKKRKSFDRYIFDNNIKEEEEEKRRF